MKISKFGIVNAEDAISAYEDVIGMKLPEQMTLFIKKYNGGETPNTSFKCGQTSSDVKGFYGLGSVRFSLEKIKPFECNERKYLPVALDSFGNDIVIDLQTGKVAFSNHETGGLTVLCEDLKSFINSCSSEPVSNGSVKSVEQRERELIEKGRGNIITDALREMWGAEIAKYGAMDLENVSI